MTTKIYNIKLMDKIRVLTKDGRLFSLLRIGESVKGGANKITCSNKDGESVELTFGDISFVFGHYKLSGLEVDTKDGRRLSVACIGENGAETGCNKIVCSIGRKTEDITFQDVERVYGVYNFFNYKKGTLG
jgi:hypothetical protein